MPTTPRFLSLTLVATLAGCSAGTGPTDGAIVWFAFDNHPADTLQVHITNPGTIDTVEQVLADRLPRMFPTGWIRPGAGVDRRYPFHYLPESVQLAQAAIEVCDGAPMHTLTEVADFMDGGITSPDGTAAYWCPWGAYPVRVQRLGDLPASLAAP